MRSCSDSVTAVVERAGGVTGATFPSLLPAAASESSDVF
jgi:hypothetical protein